MLLAILVVSIGAGSAFFALRSSRRTAPVNTAPVEVRILWIGPLSGPVMFLGRDSAQALRLAVSEYNRLRRPDEPHLTLETVDDQYDAARATDLFDRAAARSRPALVFAATYNAMFPLTRRTADLRIPLVNPIDNDAVLETLGDHVLLIAKRTAVMSKTLADDLVKQKRSAVAIIYRTDDNFMPQLAIDIKSRLEGAGMQTLLLPYHAAESNFLSHAAAARRIPADAYVFLGYQELGHAMKQLRDLGVSATFYSVNTSMAEVSLRAMEGARVLQFTPRDGDPMRSRKLLEQYRAAYGTEPSHPWSSFQTYDAANMIFGALRRIGADILSDPPRLIAELGRRQFQGVSGSIEMQRNGSIRGILWSMYTFSDGTIVPE